MIGYFKLLDHWIASFLKWSVIAGFFGLFVLMISGVLQRFIPEIKISGYEEMIEFLFVWMTYLGATAMWREGMLYRVGAFDNVFSKSVKRGLGVIIHLFMIALCWVLIFQFLQVFSSSIEKPNRRSSKFLECFSTWNGKRMMQKTSRCQVSACTIKTEGVCALHERNRKCKYWTR